MDHLKLTKARFSNAKSQALINTERHASEMENDAHKRALQTRFGEQAFNIARWYLVIVGIFMLWFLISNIAHNTILSDTVIIAILTTTTTTVIGLPYIVLRGSFEAKEEKANKTQ